MNLGLPTERIRRNDVYGRRRADAEEDLNRFARAAAQFLLPSRCLACDDRPVDSFLRGGVCEACWSEIGKPRGIGCRLCDEPLGSEDPGLCGRCLLHPPEFRRLSAATHYRGAARSVLLALKFRGADYLAPRLARVLTGKLELSEPVDEVVAVPATARDRRRRDHAADLLARAVARELGVVFSAERLAKIRPTRRQSGLPLDQRGENVRGAFRARRPTGRRVLLVDDVATSGATARACARALRRAGARAVDVWCFARAAREDELPAGN